MNSIFFDLSTNFQKGLSETQGLYASLGLFLLLGLLLVLGRRLELAIKLERLGIPIALLVGLFLLLIGPYGPIPLMPQAVTDIWVGLPTPLVTLVFATLMLGRPLPSSGGLLKPVASQAFLAFLLGFGQYLVGGVVVIFILIPLLGVDPLMGCLIEVGFEGGHGAAAVMGESFKKLGFESGLDLGLSMATVGLLSSTLIGSILVVIGRWKGWVINQNKDYSTSNLELNDSKESILNQISRLFVNLGLAGISVSIGFFMLSLLRLISRLFDGTLSEILSIFPVFPLALLASLLFRYILEIFEKTEIVSPLLQREIGTLSTDLLIVTAMASLNIEILRKDWLPLLILSLAGLLWNLFGILCLSRIIFKEEWFERSITEFGNATGVAASGLLLLRLADPLNNSNALPLFSIKQLFLQPLLSGGFITVAAPLLVNRFGLIGWTEISGLLTILFLILAIIIQIDRPMVKLD